MPLDTHDFSQLSAIRVNDVSVRRNNALLALLRRRQKSRRMRVASVVRLTDNRSSLGARAMARAGDVITAGAAVIPWHCRMIPAKIALDVPQRS